MGFDYNKERANSRGIRPGAGPRSRRRAPNGAAHPASARPAGWMGSGRRRSLPAAGYQLRAAALGARPAKAAISDDNGLLLLLLLLFVATNC